MALCSARFPRPCAPACRVGNRATFSGMKASSWVLVLGLAQLSCGSTSQENAGVDGDASSSEDDASGGRASSGDAAVNGAEGGSTTTGAPDADTSGGGAAGGDSGSAGHDAGGRAGDGGQTATQDPYGRCDSEAGAEDNPDCPAEGSICNGSQCVPPCPHTEGPGDDCPDPLSGTAQKVCYFNLCSLNCEGGRVCPNGMQCDGVICQRR